MSDERKCRPSPTDEREKAPERIYVPQHDHEGTEDGVWFILGPEVGDVEYIRADLASPTSLPADAVRGERETRPVHPLKCWP